MNITRCEPIFSETYDVGWIGFTRTFDALGDAIAYGERFERGADIPSVNHALIVTGAGQCVQAHIDNGVQRGPLSQYLDDPKSRVYFRRPLFWDRLEGECIAAHAESLIGCKYAKDLILEQAFSDTFVRHAVNEIFKNWPHYELAALVNRPGEFDCSGAAAFCLAAQPRLAGCPLFAHGPNIVDPQALFVAGPFEDFANDCSATAGTAALESETMNDCEKD